MTHINAFYEEVEEKKKTLNLAKAELEAAERALKEHPDFEEPKKESKDDPKEAEPEDKEDEVEDTPSKK